MFKKFAAALLVVLLAFPFGSVSAVSAAAYVLYNPASGEVLSQQNMNSRRSMASTTKIMTGLILCEQADTDRIVTASKKAVSVEGTSVGLKDGDKISLKNLLYGLMLESGNDAANVIAESIGGSNDEFAALMNRKAAEIGMKNTHFVTPSGLDNKDHYTTAYDMALLAAAAMENELFRLAVGTKTYKSVYNGGDTYRTYSNHNRLLSMLDGAEGVKTGFTKKSGRCLVSSCQRDGLRLIVVTLNAGDDWNDHISLYDYGFSQYEKITLDGHFSLKPVLVAGGMRRTADIKYSPAETYIKKGSADKISYVIELPVFIYAPVKVGDQIGKIRYISGGKTVAVSPVTVSSDVESAMAPEKSVISEIFNWMLILLCIC